MCSRYLLAALLMGGLALVISLPSSAGETPSKEKIDKLIEQMGSGTFQEREQASKELASIGVPALEALRKAAKSDDAEVRKRAEDLLPKIEARAESIRILKPKTVNLKYKDTPLSEAVADFRKQSGYAIRLHDPDGKLKDRKITLDTGETTFWHALELFCEKADLSEASMQDLMRVPPPPIGVPGGAPGVPGIKPLPPERIRPLPPVRPPAPPADAPAPAPRPPAADKGFAVKRQVAQAPAPPAPVPAPPVRGVPAQPPVAGKPGIAVPGRAFMPFQPGMAGQIVLKDGKAKKRPTDDHSAIRVRALAGSDQFGAPGKGEVILALEVSPEPRLQWQMFQSLHIDKALDDQDQKLRQVTPQVEGGGVGGFGVAPVPPGPGAIIGQPPIGMPAMMMGGLHQLVPVQLKKGEKAAKTLKELKGTITAQVLTEPQEIITADNLEKAAGKVFKGKAGGFIKILEVKAQDEQTTIRLEFEQPSPDKVVPAQPNMPGVGVPIGVPAPGVRILPRPRPPVKVPAPPPPPPPAAPPAGFAAQAPAAPPPPAPPAVQIQIGVGGAGGVAIGGPVQFVGPFNGLTIQDDKGKALPVQNQQMQFRMVQQGNGVVTQSMICTLVCRHDKDRGKPARVVYLGRKRTTIEVPFTLKDVPLP